MLEQIARRIAVVFLTAGLLSSCAHFSQSGRQQLAYAKYVKKQSHNRVRQQTKFKKVKMPATPPPSDFKTNTESGGSPESVTSAQSQEQ